MPGLLPPKASLSLEIRDVLESSFECRSYFDCAINHVPAVFPPGEFSLTSPGTKIPGQVRIWKINCREAATDAGSPACRIIGVGQITQIVLPERVVDARQLRSDSHASVMTPSVPHSNAQNYKNQTGQYEKPHNVDGQR